MPFVEHEGWRTWNRAGHGAWGPVHGVVIRHTVTLGTAQTVQMCHDGYGELPGPLCTEVIAKSGTVCRLDNGRANHAGLGDPDVLAAAYVASTGLLAALAAVQDHARLLDWMPDSVSPFVLALIPTAITAVSGWSAKHTPRGLG